MDEPQATPHPIKQFIGLILVVVGMLWMVASGLCSLGVIVMGFSQTKDSSVAWDFLPVVVGVGGTSIGLGLAFYVVGRLLRP
jgi:hypothetical protein